MIVGTAGHIDHGKSTLIHALTGLHPSRLAEEKRRGISIELGYAFLDRPDGHRIGFIDVPGHERLVHTMLAGATGIDAVMLLIAADDGVMPQTREHLAVMSLLGIHTGLVVITKIDRVSEARVREVADEARALIEGTSLAGAPVVSIAALEPKGIDNVRSWLFALPACEAAAQSSAGFRLAVDRSFTLSGIGTVVTGTVFAGECSPDEVLVLAPDGVRTRARSLHAQNRAAEQAVRGQRCAINVTGLGKNEPSRGAWLCTPDIAITTDRIDVALTLWRAEEKPLRSGTTVHLHCGASDVMARVVLLEGDAVAPGATMLAQLILQQSVAAWRGDRLVLRDVSATRTLAGCIALDPFAPARYRQTPQRLRMLRALSSDAADSRLREALAVAPFGLDLHQWLRAEGLVADAAASLVARAEAVIVTATQARPAVATSTAASASASATLPAATNAKPASTTNASTRWVIGRAAWQLLKQQLLEAVTRFHDEEPQALGLDNGRLRRLGAPRADAVVTDQAVRELIDSGQLARHGAFVHLPEHLVTLSPAEQRLAQALLPRIQTGAYDPPWARDLAKDLRVPEVQMRTTLARMAIRGEVFQVVKDLYYAAPVIEGLASVIREIAASGSAGVEAAVFRDRTGLGRKRAIQILEFFDRVGLLRRVRDTHLLRPGTEMFLSPISRAPMR